MPENTKISFSIAPDALPVERIPKRTLITGAQMPAIGLGTFGSDSYSAEDIAQALLGAVAIGYRHIDCAAVYGNEPEIGECFRSILQVVPREDLWINSKLWNDKHAPKDVIPACRQSLADLGLDYLDCYFVHWPFPNYHAPGCDIDSRSPDAKPYIHESYMKTWREMEKLVEMGLVRHIGTSNMTIPKLELLLRDARIPPAVNEMELHPHFQQPELFQYCLEHHIAPIGFCPIGSPSRPERDRTPEDTAPTEDPVMVKIAERLGVHPAVVCVKWAVQRGQTPIPFSTNPRNYRANLECTLGNPLTEEEMRAIMAVDRGNRLIKGHVFLWKDNQDWRDLWDPNGVIPQ